MTFLASSSATNAGQPTNMFTNQSLPVLTTRPALGPSGQLVHVLTTPGPILTADPSTVPITLAVGPLSAGPHSGGSVGNSSNNSSNSRGLTRTGKKRKSAPQTVASILQGAQLAAITQQQQNHHHQATTLTLSSQDVSGPPQQLVYNVQNFQQIQPQPQQTIQTLALMPDGKTYVVVNSQPAPAPPQSLPQQQQPNTAGHWLLSPRPATGQLIAPAGQPMNVTNLINGINGFCTTQNTGPTATTFVLGGTGGPQVLQLQDGTFVQTTDQSNLLTNYGGLFIRCPPTPTFSPTPVRTLPMPVPIAPGRSPGRSPDSSSVESNNNIITSTAPTSTAPTLATTTTVACGEATPPASSQPLSSSSSSSSSVGTAHPSPVVQSSQIDSCVQEDTSSDPEKSNSLKRPDEYNNNNNNSGNNTQQQHQLWSGSKPTELAVINAATATSSPTVQTVIQLSTR